MNKLPSEIKLVVFDVDGTITDSIGRIIECMRLAAERYDVKIPTNEEVKDIIGITLRQAVGILFSDQSEKMVDDLTEEYKVVYKRLEDEKPTGLFPSVMETLQTLKDRGYILAIATGKSKNGLARLYRDEKLFSMFSGSVTGDMAKSKPDPMMLNMLLKQFNLKPSQAVMIGDSNLDLQMAKNCGAYAVGVTTGVHSAEILSKVGPNAIIDDLKDLLEILN